MSYLLLARQFAATYDCNTYGSGAYNSAGECVAEAAGGLSATGTDVMIGIGVGVVLIVLAVVLILRNRKKK